ncbi:MAG: hypothetical protein ACKOYN_10925 [Planctomycetota bacterium]
MAIETRLHSRQTIWHIAYTLACVLFAAWGWYDYAVKYPAQDARYAEYKELSDIKERLDKGDTAALTPEEQAELRRATDGLAKFVEVPAPRSRFDYQVQIWVYMVGCGASAPFFVLMNIQARRKRYRLDDDGTLTTPDGTFRQDEIVGLDLSKWMDKWIAKVKVADGREVALDDYKYQYTEDIVGVLAARFEPGQWTSDARPIGDPKSRDTKKALAEQEAREAAGASDDGDPQGS